MRKEDLVLLSQLLYTMKEVVLKLEEYQKANDDEKMAAAKKEIIYLQRKIDLLT